MTENIPIFLSALLLGISAGFSPGPLLTLVISVSLRHGFIEGVKVSMAPLITDLPIIIVSVLVLSRLKEVNIILFIVSSLGCVFLLYLSHESLTFKGEDLNIKDVRLHSFHKGVLANLFNPNPYLFWFSIGSPIIIRSNNSIISTLIFVCTFFSLLIGAKIIISSIVSRFKNFLSGKVFIWINRLLGVVLLFYAVWFFKDALKYIRLTISQV